MNVRRISIRSLGYYLIKRLPFILVMMLVCGCVFAGIKYISDKKNAVQPRVPEDGSTLTGMERNDAENAALNYRYAVQTERYLNNSPLFRVNPRNETQDVLEYSILLDTPSGEETSGTKEYAYLQMLRAFVYDGMYVSGLVEISQEYENNKYIRDLITSNATGGGELSINIINTPTFPNLTADFKKVFEAYADQMMKQEKGLKIQLVKESNFNFYDGATESTQKNTNLNFVNYRNAYLKSLNVFSPAQRAYFQKLIEYMNAADEDASTSTKSEYDRLVEARQRLVVEESQKSDPAPNPVSISKVDFLIGCLVGVFAAIAICFILMYLSLKNRTVLDYSSNLGLRDLGLMTVGEKKHPIRSWISKKELKNSLFASDEESVDYAAVRIGAYCKSHEVDELAVLSSKSNSVIEKSVEALKKALEKEGVKLHSTEKVVLDAEALKVLLDSKNAILIEQLYGGNRQKASELLKFCKENDVEVIGGLGVLTIKR